MLRQLRNAALGRMVACHVAGTKQEQQAVARLRYETYIQEQHVTMKEADHGSQALWIPEEDEAPETLHFYAGRPEAMLGTLRTRVWGPGAMPRYYFEGYSMDLLPDMGRRTICEVSKLMVRPDLRGGAAMVALTGFAIDYIVKAYRNELVVAVCVPGLLRRYEAIGLRHFGGRLLSTGRGVVIPLIGITNDVEHTYRIGSPWYPALRRLQRAGRLPEDLPACRAQAERDRSVVTEPRQVRAELERFAKEGPPSLLRGLSGRALAALSRHGLILDVPPGLALCREGVADQEVYLVLAGEFDVVRGEQQLARLGPGQIFGEMALLSPEGRRTAEVRSVGAGRVLVLRRKFLPAIRKVDPSLGAQIHGGLVQELIRKLGGQGG